MPPRNSCAREGRHRTTASARVWRQVRLGMSEPPRSSTHYLNGMMISKSELGGYGFPEMVKSVKTRAAKFFADAEWLRRGRGQRSVPLPGGYWVGGRTNSRRIATSGSRR